MEKIKIGDIVARKSYNKDILFRVKNIVDTKKGQIEEYMNLILEEYIENGSYEIDNKKYFKQMLNNYEEIEKIVGDSYEYKFKNQRSKRIERNRRPIEKRFS